MKRNFTVVEGANEDTPEESYDKVLKLEQELDEFGKATHPLGRAIRLDQIQAQLLIELIKEIRVLNENLH